MAADTTIMTVTAMVGTVPVAIMTSIMKITIMTTISGQLKLESRAGTIFPVLFLSSQKLSKSKTPYSAPPHAPGCISKHNGR